MGDVLRVAGAFLLALMVYGLYQRGWGDLNLMRAGSYVGVCTLLVGVGYLSDAAGELKAIRRCMERVEERTRDADS